MIKWSASKDGEQYPAHGASERGRTVRVPRRRGGKALPSPGRKWPGGPRRYRAGARARPFESGANSGGTADCPVRPEPWRLGAFFMWFGGAARGLAVLEGGVARRLERLDFNALWPGFRRYGFALYDGRNAVADGAGCRRGMCWPPSWPTRCSMPISRSGGTAV